MSKLRLRQPRAGVLKNTYLSLSLDSSQILDLNENIDLSIFENSSPGLYVFPTKVSVMQMESVKLSTYRTTLACVTCVRGPGWIFLESCIILTVQK